MFKDIRFTAIISVVIGFMAVLLSGCASTAVGGGAGSAEKALKITIPGEPLTIDPTKSIETNGGAVIDQVSEGIYRRDANNKIAAGVVDEVVKPTDNGTKYTFNIKKDAKWQDGSPIKSEDFVNSIDRQADPKTKSQQTTSIQYIENFAAVNNGKADPSKLGIHAVNDRTFTVKLTKPVPFMNYEFTNFYPIQTAAIKKYGSHYGTNSETTVANGAYTITGWNGSNDSWKYEKNKNYWDAKNVKIPEVDVTVVKDNNTAQNMFNGGQIDLTSLTGQYVKQNKNNKNLVVTETGRNNYIYFNDKKKATSNENLRKAISMVIDQDQLAKDVLQDGSIGANNIVPKNYAKDPKTGKDFTSEMGDQAPTDTTKAKQYWAKAQKEIGKDKISLDFLVDDTDTEKKLAEYVQGAVSDNLKGLTINIESVPHATHVTRDFSTDFDICTVGWGPDYPDAQNFLDGMRSNNTINFSKFKDQQYDDLMNKVDDTTKYDANQRWDFERQADKRLMSIAAVAPTYQASQAHLISSKVGGLKWDAMSGQSGKLQYAYWK
ncbi:peptide ABC transporter substrate-binding protein [Lentilactobacillus buchneri]|uniref:peptide ABC transporter substrate-binding protein n=1 Tax=Lentilactobacillus buchneri TaxID=1581 RepID=UPI0012919A37|nr:peptide ABC transporter substrate-binding protein [Lentilactobacillus buchneri]MQM59652.1 peptide ABC transporter substrate-binding protein [Lentilactobacillus buchneri]MQM79346.1 peptide ABC transporter substrate-binding protein [Lentilactobacillus buchneri]